MGKGGEGRKKIHIKMQGRSPRCGIVGKASGLLLGHTVRGVYFGGREGRKKIHIKMQGRSPRCGTVGKVNGLLLGHTGSIPVFTLRESPQPSLFTVKKKKMQGSGRG